MHDVLETVHPAHLGHEELPHVQVIVGGDPNENPGQAADDILRCQPGIFERFPGHLQQQALFGVHANVLAHRFLNPCLKYKNLQEV